ncbi:MAG: ribosome small subunit-dependent GTPase A [Clostridiales bacterium]|nr:ribosome small subunit-dependent GTPase A [Clostridiales bacterium]
MTEGRIAKALSGFFYVDTQDSENGEHRVYQCRARGIFRKEGIVPLVGDFVRMRITDKADDEGIVEEIFPRRNAFVRPPVANIDLFFVTLAAADPEPNPALTDLFLANAEAAHADAAVIVNKEDLDPVRAKRVASVYKGVYPVCLVSAKTGEGVDSLRLLAAGKNVAFAGASGVGKTSLLVRLAGMDGRGGQGVPETGGVSRRTGRGRHTTRHVEIFKAENGARYFDTPGFSSFDFTEAGDGIFGLADDRTDSLFPEFRPWLGQCRFDDCTHTCEPDCAVRAALAAGKIRASRYESYVKLLEEVKRWRNCQHRS